jgi:hypothetical protein
MLKFSLEPAPAPAKAYRLEDLQPDVKCHCCNDSGKIQPQLIQMAIPLTTPKLTSSQYANGCNAV